MPNYVTQMSKDSGAAYQVKDTGARVQISEEVTARESAIAAEASAREAEINELKSALIESFDIIDSPVIVNSGKYINQSGQLISNASWHTTGYITVKSSIMFIQGNFSNLGTVGYNIGLYNSERSFVKGYILDATASNGKFVDVSDASYVMICNITTNPFTYGFLTNSMEAEIVRKETETRILSDSDYTVVGYLRPDGTVNSGSSDWVTTGFIPVNHLGLYTIGRWYSLSGVGYNICAYDARHNFINGIACNSYEDMAFLDISGASYIRFSSHDPHLSQTVLLAFRKSNADKEIIVDVNGGGDYTSLLAALKATSDDTTIRLRKGVYDAIAEYEAFYGSDFFTNYDGYATVSDPFYRGLWLSTGRKIRGDAGAIIRCVYTGSNTKVATLFSCIANAGNVLLENVTIEHGNLRYAIHDDYGAQAGQTIEFRNIRFIGHSNGAVIGAGLGVNTNVIIDGCVFEGNRQPWDINYHGSNSAVADNTNIIRITNCCGNHGCGFWPNGPSTALSTAYVSNCKFSEITLYRPDGQDASQVMNMELIEWCNDIGS